MSYRYSPPSARDPSSVRTDIKLEFSRWDQQAGERVIGPDFDLPFAKDGTREAVVTFFLRGDRRNVRVSAWPDFRVNLVCCYLIIRDMRLAEARGLADAIREAYGLLPAPATERDPWEVLELRPGASIDVVKSVYRTKAKMLHPDTGGLTANAEEFQALTRAYERVTGETPA